jgi:DNA-directed DNA polymerase III PolC
MTDYVSLHNHTHYSILSSLISPKELFNRAKELGQPAIALTDYSTLSGAWESLKYSRETGVKLIVGCEFYFVDSLPYTDQRFRRVILLAKNQTGYRNLLALNKYGNDNATSFHKRVYPLIDWKLLEEHSDGLICLTSCASGILGQLIMLQKITDAEQQLQRLIKIFADDLGLEIQPNTLKRGSALHDDNIDQVFVNGILIRWGEKYGVRVVATTNAHYLHPTDHEIHDVMLAIGAHQPVYSNFRTKYNCPDFYVKSGDEVKKFFERNYKEKAEQFLANSLYFANKCEQPDWIDPKFSNPSGKELPVFPIKDEADYSAFLEWQKTRSKKITDLDEDKQYLRFRCENVFLDRAPKDKVPAYRKRLEDELDVFNYCNAASYMLIVADYVAWARKNGISVGPGRGSVGGSLVAWLLNIHMADPIKYDLVFERFYSKKRASYADIDLDFSQSSRERVIAYIISKYGQENVAQISNFVAITPKVYVRDITRSCELAGSRIESVELGDRIAECIPNEVKTINVAHEKVPLFAEYAKRYPELLKYKAISNKPRNTSLHAAGVVISHRPLHTIVPTRRDKDGVYALEYDKDVAEANGLVKMDILGLTTLDIIEATNTLIRQAGKIVPDIDYEAYDEKTYDLISRGDTFGVFQFGTSGGTIDLCKQIKPKSIEDLAIITTLARPASKEIRKLFIKVKNGTGKSKLLHPSLQNAFAMTLGFALYDESLLILAKDVAGWDLDEADKLRKLTKEKGKNPEKVVKWKEEFIAGAVGNGIDSEKATEIWDKICIPFGLYSFNKCLDALTGVSTYTSDGEFVAEKPIRDVQVGDFVRSRDESSGNDIFVRVSQKYDQGIQPLVDVELDTGARIKCTMNHKFRAGENREMLPLWKIRDRHLNIVVDIVNVGMMGRIVNITPVNEGQTYDIGVDHIDHQFYLSNGVLTSNSHAVLYSMISYHTAYLKAHFPIEFLMANLMDEIKSNSPKAEANIQKIKAEIRAHDVKILPPDLNRSSMHYTLHGAELLTGLDAIKFVSDDAIKDIIAKRPFTSFKDFIARTDSRRVRANTIQALASSGCLDWCDIPRHLMYLYCSDYRKKLTVWLKRHTLDDKFEYPWPKDGAWSVPQTYAMECRYLGEGFICQPKVAYGAFFNNRSSTIKEIKQMSNKTEMASMVGIIRDFFEFRIKKETSKFYGRLMIKAVLEDANGDHCSLTIFPDRWDMVQQRIKQVGMKTEFESGIALHFAATSNTYEDEVGLILERLYSVHPIPQCPSKPDLKSRKISMRLPPRKDVKPQNAKELAEQIEDDLIVEGMIEIDDPLDIVQ